MNTPTLVIDIDHTICVPNDAESDTFKKYGMAEPIQEMISAIRAAKESGFKIILFTARRMATHNGDINKVIEDVGDLTKSWLKDNNVPYDELMFGKPNAVYYVDDKALTPNQFIDLMMKRECE
jgi:capsule biosynthesis phosphatase